LNRRELARHYNGRSARERIPRTLPANVTVRSVAVHRPLVIAPELKAGLGPFADSQPRVAVVAVSGLLALADIAGGTFHRRRPLSLNWQRDRRVPGVLGAWHNSERVGPLLKPLSLGGLAFASAERSPIAAAVTVGVLMATALWLRTQVRGVRAACVLTEKPDLAAPIGAGGGTLVAGEVSALGWPVLRNVILGDGAHSMEIDLLVCVSDGVLVLEAKTWSGFISGLEAGPIWT